MKERRRSSEQRSFGYFSVLMVILLLVGSYILISQYMEYRNVQIELEKNQHKLIEQQELNQKLKDEKSKAQSPEEIEKKAREDLGLVKLGEIPVRTIPTKSKNETKSP
jgi:cell division protein FtsL